MKNFCFLGKDDLGEDHSYSSQYVFMEHASDFCARKDEHGKKIPLTELEKGFTLKENLIHYDNPLTIPGYVK